MLLKGKTAIVTGASRGCGAATALWFAREGAAVVVNYGHHAEAAEEIVCRITAAGGRALAVAADVSDAEAVKTMAETARRAFGGRIDVLVNNAFPGFIGGTVGDASWEAFRTAWEIIVHGAFNCCQAVLPAMVKQRYGRIINIGTTSIWDLNESHAPYITAKGCVFFASELADFITGANLPVCGGLIMQ